MAKYACITLDMEQDYGDPLKRVHLLDDAQQLERFSTIVNRYGARVTMFTVTSLFENYGEGLRRLEACVPLEYAVHSHTHDPKSGTSEAELLAAGKAFKTFTGREASAYRAPIGRIDNTGLGRLIDHGYSYDSSVYTSIRPGEYGYFNLHLPNEPFWITRGGERFLLEFPFTALSTVRVVYALSYAKMLGWSLFSMLLKWFGLPDVALLLVHPYNFYTRRNAAGLHGLERWALTRNDGKSFEYFEKMVAVLSQRGYEFLLLSEIYEQLRQRLDLPSRAWEQWK